MAAGDFVFVSGQLPINSNSADGGDVSFEAQVQVALDNVLSVVTAAGSTVEDIVRCTAYIVGVENWPEFNRVYAAKFGAHRPARTVVPVVGLHFGYLVEIDAIALRRAAQST
jgi:enamine deaminase RidA (YjgF/YER057c/UK114 family)